MNYRLLSAALACLIAAPVLAADGDENDFFKTLKAGQEAVKAQQDAKKAAAPASKAPAPKEDPRIEKTLVAMNDGNEVGTLIADYVKTKNIKIKLDAKLPDYPRAVATAIAAQAVDVMFADMPDCAEKQYMGLSLGARAWLELGGDKKALPVIEPLAGYKDQILSDQFKLWLDNGSEMALYKIGQQSKTPDLMALLDKEKDPKKKEALEAANKRFIAFLLSETEWKQANAFRLQ